MDKVYSDEWTNFIIIDRSASQESFVASKSNNSDEGRVACGVAIFTCTDDAGRVDRSSDGVVGNSANGSGEELICHEGRLVDGGGSSLVSPTNVVELLSSQDVKDVSPHGTNTKQQHSPHSKTFDAKAADADNNGKQRQHRQHTAREVCQLLGLPRGTAGKNGTSTPSRGMMSSNTEQKLRELVSMQSSDTLENQGGVNAGGVNVGVAAEMTSECESIAFTADEFPHSSPDNMSSKPTSEDGMSPPFLPQLMGDNWICNDDTTNNTNHHLFPKGVQGGRVGEEGFANHMMDLGQTSHQWQDNILSEGEYYLAMSLLVYVYSLLREASTIGHTTIAFEDIDVNSYQSLSRSSSSVDRLSVGTKGGSMCHLDETKTAGYIIRVVMDELSKNGTLLGHTGTENDDGDWRCVIFDLGIIILCALLEIVHLLIPPNYFTAVWQYHE